eukprot:NODE_646_length_5582_cov_0.573044.p1 type:complete len:546 gc:universal NODE_646_length_5582_cov_0.573044:3001-1364(-)
MPHRSEDYKETAVRDYLEQSHNRAETSRIFNCETMTLGRWIARCKRKEVSSIPINTSCYYYIRSIKEVPLSASALLLEEWPLTLAVIALGCGSAYISLKIPQVTGDLVNTIAKSLQGSSLVPLRNIALSLGAFHLLKGCNTAFSIGLVNLLGERVAFNTRNRLFDNLIYKELNFFDKTQISDLTNRLGADTQDLKHTIKQICGKGIKSTLELTGITIRLFQISSHLTGMMLGFTPVLLVFGNMYASFLRRLSRDSKDSEAFATVTANEALSNMKTVKAFTAEEKEKEMYSRSCLTAKNANILLGVHVGIFQAMVSNSVGWMVLSILYYGGIKVSRNEMEAGDLMTYMLSVEAAQKSFINLGELFAKSKQAMACIDRIYYYMNLENYNYNPKNMLSEIKGHIELKNVSFKYENRNQLVLDKVSLEIPNGKTLALCGSSGGGKSTVASLLEKFYIPQEGIVTIDGFDINDLSTKSLRANIGYITQDPVLFATTILENIKYGNTNATMAEVIEAARMANAHDFISSFQNGYNTRVGERGATLSGGILL